MGEKLKDLKIEANHDVNILLLGETGVGKSTFINSLANYLHHQELQKALKHPLFHLIPSTYFITDENCMPQKVVIGSDDNEFHLVGDSATRDVRTYVFPIGTGKTRLRLIDTPGIGNPRGVEPDNANCENILSYIGNLHHLHAICLLFRPNDARITITIEYCVKQILSRLEKSAAKNIIFISTSAKATNYKPGKTIACLKKVVEDIKRIIPNVEIQVEDNVFCFDTDAFRYLAAVKQNIKFGVDTKAEHLKSWANSSKEAEKLIKYILGYEGREALIPYMVKSPKSINEARRVINLLAQPLADISQLILDNLQILDRRRKELQDDNISLDKLKEKLYVPMINLKVINLTHPTTVCCNTKCAEFLMIDDKKTWNYKQRCHDPCYLRNVPQEIIGAPQLENCETMEGRTCKICRCAQIVHKHIYYMTEKYDDKKIDENVQSKITTIEEGQKEAEKIIILLLGRKHELQHERDVIINCIAKFASFLQKNAITSFNDAYREYIKYMILREQSLGWDADQQAILHFQSLLSKYDQFKATFDKATEMSGSAGGVAEIEAKDVHSHLQQLYALKHNGKKIRELYSSQKTSLKKEHEQTEYVHSSPIKQPEQKSDKLQTQSNMEEKKEQKKQEKIFKNYHQHGIHEKEPNPTNNQKPMVRALETKYNAKTNLVSDFGTSVKQPEQKSDKLQTQSIVEEKKKKNKKKVVFNLHQHENEPNPTNNQKPMVQILETKDNAKTNLVSDFGTKKQIKIGKNEIESKPDKRNAPLQNNQRGTSKLIVLNNPAVRINDSQSNSKQQGNNYQAPSTSYYPPAPQTHNHLHFQENIFPNQYALQDSHRYVNLPPFNIPPPPLHDNRPPCDKIPPPSYDSLLFENRLPYNSRTSYNSRAPYDNRDQI